MKRKSRCGECDGCRTANCGSCLYCRDMIKFGGQGKMKQACSNRACVTRSLEAASKKNKHGQDTRGRKRNDRSNRSKGSHRCDQCKRQFHQKNDLEAHLLTHSIQNPLKCTDGANSQDEKVKIENNDNEGYKSSESEIKVTGEMCSNHNLMEQSETMFINNNDRGVVDVSMLEDGTDIEKSPVVSILTEKAKFIISEKQFSKTEGSDAERPLREITSESAVKTIETGVNFNEVPANEKKSEDNIKKNETRVESDDVTVISDDDDDTDLSSNSLDRPYEIKRSENYSGRIDVCFNKVEVPKNVEGLKYLDNEADSENNTIKVCNNSQYIKTDDPHKKNLNGDLMAKPRNNLEVNNVTKISQQSVNEDHRNCNESSKASVIINKQSFEIPEKNLVTEVSSIDNAGKPEKIKSENIIRKNKTSLKSTDTAVIVLDDDMDKSDQSKEECCENYSSPIRTNYSRGVKEIEAEELVQDETAQPEKVLTTKMQDNGVQSKQATNKENISNESIFEVNGNLRIPAVTLLNNPIKHCEGDERKNKIIETDNEDDMSREVSEMSEFSTSSDEDSSSDESEALIDQLEEEEEHYDRHSNLNLSVPIPSFSHPLLSLTRSPAGPTPPTKCSSQRGGDDMDRVDVESTRSRCPRFQEIRDITFEDINTLDFESPTIDDRSIEDIFEDFIKRKSVYII